MSQAIGRTYEESPVNLFALLLALASTGAGAYPTKPVRIVVPFAAGGGGTDSLARLLGQKLTEALGQTVIVDNRPGAGGTIGTELAARAAADGYTLLMVNAGHVINPHIYKKLPYDSVKSFDPVALIATASYVLVVHPSVPAKSVKDLIELGKARTDLSFASSGIASTPHLAGELFSTMAGIKMTHVPYKGGGPANTALVSGEVSCYFGSVSGALPHIRSGRTRALAVTGVKRSPALPAVPTIAEAALPEYDITGWFGMLAPAGTPQEAVATLNRALGKALQQPDVRKRLLEHEGADPAGGSAAEFAQFISAELRKYAEIARISGARLE
ncbi:MAG: tripartite tricarboxylate transporter substrate binding protein [Betaproteobacteria bacterium]|nr:tripartite tricarboxylate transporter substrate binding protein [Betaproteobacteria bacterium]